jgi:hypothetical protein
MSLEDLIDGCFERTNLAWAFIGEEIPPVGCHDPDLGEI